MDEDIFPDYKVINAKRTYSKPIKRVAQTVSKSHNMKTTERPIKVVEPLTTKNCMKFLLEGNLKSKVCRYCLNVSPALSELDQILQVAGTGSLYKVTIRAMVASFHPVKVADDPNFPNKICQICVDKAINAYLFSQQCERAERALWNCFDDMSEKLDKLDPLDRPKKRGRQKQNPNYNILYAEHKKVIDYAEPIINMINIGAESITNEPELNPLECKKCWQVLPNTESLLNHEKIHPKTMWYNCRLCGKSFPKYSQLKRHHNRVHILGKDVQQQTNNEFKCKECGNVTENYKQHLQHVEKHKFKNVLDHLVHRKMDNLCMVCFDKGAKLVDLNNMVCIHGGYPELMGDKTLYNLLSSTLPDMNFLHDFIGTKICDKCLSHTITSYIFIQHFIYTRERLGTCVSLMLNNLKGIKPVSNVFVQIAPHVIMPLHDEVDENLLLDENDYVDENQLKVDVLEDEFRVKSDTESDKDVEDKQRKEEKEDTKTIESIDDEPEEIDNPARNVTKSYSKKLVNGLQSTKYPLDICSEFLTFKKRKTRKVWCKFTCPVCSKHFISEYFLKRHILKHLNKKVECNICNTEFKSKFYLYEHMKMEHLLKQNHLSCKVCGRCFVSQEKLVSHAKQHRLKTCQLCNKIYTSQRFYESHMQRHAAKLKLIKQKCSQTCSFCEKECLNDNELSIHVNKVHLQIKPYNCDMCERQFYSEKNLKCHKMVHSMPSKETCEFCSKIFSSRKKLVIHVRQHIGVKPFACQICSQGFYSSYKAREHMKVYHGGRFCCRICKSTFVTKYGLKDHVNKDHNII